MIWGYPYFWKHPGDKQWIPSRKHQTKDYDYCTETDIQKSFEKSVCMGHSMGYIYYRCNDIQYCYIEIEIIKIHQYWYRYGFDVMPSNRFSSSYCWWKSSFHESSPPDVEFGDVEVGQHVIWHDPFFEGHLPGIWGSFSDTPTISCKFSLLFCSVYQHPPVSQFSFSSLSHD